MNLFIESLHTKLDLNYFFCKDDLKIFLKAYIVGSNGNIWTTSDRGQTYSFLNVANQISDFKSLARFVPHPANEDWALAYTASARCVNASAPGYCYYSVTFAIQFFKLLISFFFSNNSCTSQQISV